VKKTRGMRWMMGAVAVAFLFSGTWVRADDHKHKSKRDRVEHSSPAPRWFAPAPYAVPYFAPGPFGPPPSCGPFYPPPPPVYRNGYPYYPGVPAYAVPPVGPMCGAGRVHRFGFFFGF
jgi:hypothetical protein